jgi:hypothetical protein
VLARRSESAARKIVDELCATVLVDDARVKLADKSLAR